MSDNKYPQSVEAFERVYKIGRIIDEIAAIRRSLTHYHTEGNIVSVLGSEDGIADARLYDAQMMLEKAIKQLTGVDK